MSRITQSFSLKDATRLTQRAKTPLIVIREAVTNAIEAIRQRREAFNNDFMGEVTLTLNLQKDLVGDLWVSQFDIVDNGIGFNEENRNRFHAYGDTSKCYNNKGTGKIHYLHWFDKVTVDSFYQTNNGSFKHYEDTATQENDFDYSDEDTENTLFCTTVSLKNLEAKGNESQKLFELIQLQDINKFKGVIIKMFLPYLVVELGVNINISFRVIIKGEAGDILSDKKESLNKEDVNFAVSSEKVYVTKSKMIFDDSKIRFESIKDSEREIIVDSYSIPTDKGDGNGVYFSRKQTILSKAQPKDIGFKWSLYEKTPAKGFYTISVISGDLFDNTEYLTDAGEWTFPRKKGKKDRDMILETEGSYFQEDIDQAIQPALRNAFSPLIETLQSNEINVQDVMKRYGFTNRYDARIEIGDSVAEIVTKLYKAESAHNAQNSIKMMERYQHFSDIESQHANPLSDDFQQDLEKTTSDLLQLTDAQNRDELSKYIIRRDIIAKMLEKLVNKEINSDGQPEGIIHDLIFKRRTQRGLNDLWLFNEDFVHYQSVASEVRLQDIIVDNQPLFPNPDEVNQAIDELGEENTRLLNKRPDIFIFTEAGACVLIELKAPNVKVEDHIAQLYKYSRIIANFAEVNRKKITRFYGYLIGGEVGRLANLPDFNLAPCERYWFKEHTNIKAYDDNATTLGGVSLYQEIIPYKTVIALAKKRNRSFARKLGLEG